VSAWDFLTVIIVVAVVWVFVDTYINKSATVPENLTGISVCDSTDAISNLPTGERYLVSASFNELDPFVKINDFAIVCYRISTFP